jgi:hypothetical protein
MGDDLFPKREQLVESEARLGLLLCLFVAIRSFHRREVCR